MRRTLFEIWLGEAKIYEDGLDAVSAAISSIRAHIDQGFF
ncbi:Hachiman antiphage defense system protein HamA [Ancylobacter dichloromethanicus]